MPKPEGERIEGAFPLPADLRQGDAYMGSTKWPVGRYTFQIDRAELPSKADVAGVNIILQCLHGPNDTNDMTGQEMRAFYSFKSAEAIPYFTGFVKQVAPWALEDAFLPPRIANQFTLDFSFLSGGKGGQGAIIEGFVIMGKPNPQTGRTFAELDKSSPLRLIKPSSYAVEKLRAAGRAAELEAYNNANGGSGAKAAPRVAGGPAPRMTTPA